MNPADYEAPPGSRRLRESCADRNAFPRVRRDDGPFLTIPLDYPHSNFSLVATRPDPDRVLVHEELPFFDFDHALIAEHAGVDSARNPSLGLLVFHPSAPILGLTDASISVSVAWVSGDSPIFPFFLIPTRARCEAEIAGRDQRV